MFAEQITSHPLQQQYPMFHVAAGRHSDVTLYPGASEKLVQMTVVNRKHHASIDEFTLL